MNTTGSVAPRAPTEVGTDWVNSEHPPEMLLFLSVDIEGSTNFKHETEGPSSWGPFFIEFFKSFPSILSSEEKKIRTSLQLPAEKRFALWKTLGDEMIFSMPLSSGVEAFASVCSAIQALRLGAQKLKQHHDNWAGQQELPWRLKATAWVAGFPIKNMKITLDHKTDYIGPSIDLGFRLTKIATPSRMVISVPLAWIISKVQYGRGEHIGNHKVDFCYYGRERLKGINLDYPVFWIDVSQGANLPQEEIDLIARGHIEAVDVVRFCETLFKDKSNNINTPFVFGDHDEYFCFPQDTDRAEEYIKSYKQVLLTIHPQIAQSQEVSKPASATAPTFLELMENLLTSLERHKK